MKSIINLTIIYWSILVLATWFFSLLGIYSWELMRLLWLIPAAYLLHKLYKHRNDTKVLGAKYLGLIKTFIKIPDFLNLLVVAVALCWLFFFAYSALKVFLYPPTNWDSMTYHLTKIANANQRGTMWHDPETPIDRANTLASNAEILNMQAFSILGKDFFVELPQLFSVFIILVCLIYIFTRHFNYNKRLAFLATSSLLTIPLFWQQSFTTQNDLVFIAIVLLSIAKLLDLKNHFSKYNLVLTSIAISVAIGTKFHGLVVGCITGLFLLRYLYINRKKVDLKFLIPTVIASSVIAFPNYVIARIYYGDFLYVPGANENIAPGIDTFIKNVEHFVNWFYKMPNWDPEYFSMDYGHMGLAFMFILPIFFVTSSIYLYKRKIAEESLILLTTTSFFTLIFFVFHYPDEWDLRLFLFTPTMVLYVTTLFLLSGIQWKVFVLTIVGLMSAFSALHVVQLFRYVDKEELRHSFNKFYAGEGLRTIAEKVNYYRPALKQFDLHTASKQDIKILFNGRGDMWLYPFYGHAWQNEIYFENDRDKLFTRANEENIDYIIVGHYIHPKFKKYIPEEKYLKQFNLVAKDEYFDIYFNTALE